MKKKLGWAAVALFVIFFIMYLIPKSISKQANINANFDNTYRILSNLAGWEKWNPAVERLYEDASLTVTPSGNKKNITFSHKNDSISIKEINPLAFNVAGNIQAEIFSYNFSLIPSQSTYAITIELHENTRLLYTFFPFLRKPSEGEKALTALKKYLENSLNIYGYTINAEKVTKDTVFAVIEASEAKKDVFKTMQQRFAVLSKYVHENGLKQNGFFSISYIPRNDSVFLITGVKVNKFAAPSLPVHCVNVPKNAKMLTAVFNGKFADRNKIFTAFEKYRRDHFLETVGSPIESYIDNKLPVSDSSTVQFKLYYPVR